MGLRAAMSVFRQAELWPGVVNAVPPGAPRPSMTLWYDPGGPRPPVAWAPVTGEFETLWDSSAWWAWQIPGVWRARKLIADTVGAMTLGGWKGLVAVQPLPSVLAEPAAGENRCNTVAAWVGDLLDHGNAVGYYAAFNAEEKPVSVQPWPCTDVEIGRLDPGSDRVLYRFGGPTGLVFDRSMVFHAKANGQPKDLRGLGVLEVGLSTLDRARAESDYATKAFNSGTPSGLLRVHDPDLQVGSDDDDPSYATAKGIKKAWQSSITTGDVAVLSDLVDFQPLSWTPTDAQMVEARQLSLVDVANLYGLDPFWLGAPSAPMVYQNVNQAGLVLSRFTLEFPITALEAEFSRMLPRGTEARFNRDSILRDDQTTRVENWIKLVNAGIVTPEYVRSQEGIPEDAGGDPPVPAPALFPVSDPAANEQASA